MSDGPHIGRQGPPGDDFSNRSRRAHWFDDLLIRDDAPPHSHFGTTNFEDPGGGVATQVPIAGGVICLNNVVTFVPVDRVWTNGIAGERVTVEWRAARLFPCTNLNQETAIGLVVDANNYIGIGWSSNALANFQIVSYIGGARQFIQDTGIATDTNWHRFRVALGGAVAQFFIDGALVYTNTNPGVDFLLGFYAPGVRIRNQDGDCDLDWVDTRQEFTGDRNP